MNRFVILMYHSIVKVNTKSERRYSCSPELFKMHMTYLYDNGYQFVGLNDIEKYYKNTKAVPDKSIVITFDDGFEDNYIHAFPVLEEFNIPANIFLVSDLMGKTNEWMLKEPGKSKKMLNWEQVNEMKNHGIEFGGHTVSHPRLTEITLDQANRQITDCKKQIEDNVNDSISTFAYPYGLFNQQIVELVEGAGFNLSCSVRSGFNQQLTETQLLRRLEITGTDSLKVLQRKLTFGSNDASIFLPLKYYSNRIKEHIGIK